MMEVRYAVSNKDVRTYDTKRLSRNFTSMVCLKRMK